MHHHKQKISRWQGAGLLATTLLGTSVFILPQMTINIASSWALLSWALLVIAIMPVALVFAKLASLYPHAGGPAYFVEKAYGKTAGRTVGLLFLFIVPIGAPAAIIMTYWFLETLLQLPTQFALPFQLGIIGLLYLLNYRGIQFSAIMQLGLTVVIALLIVALLIGKQLLAPESHSESGSQPFELNAVLSAMSLAFWSFLGIEAISHLAGDFNDPKRDFIPAVIAGSVIVGLIYFGCTYLLLDTEINQSIAMISVFNDIVGDHGAWLVGLLGVAGGLATVNVYTASLSRLVWSLSNDAVLPAYFRQLNTYHIPQRALQCILVFMTITIVVSHVGHYELEHLIGWVNGVFVLIYLASLIAALKLLSKKQRPLIVCGCILCGAVAVGLAEKMIYALFLFALFVPLLVFQQRRLQKANTTKRASETRASEIKPTTP